MHATRQDWARIPFELIGELLDIPARIADRFSMSCNAARNASAMFESGHTLDRGWLREVGYLEEDDAAI